MNALIVLLFPLAIAYGLYLWSEIQDKAKHSKRVKAGKKSWKKRVADGGHYLVINNCLNDTQEVVWLEA